MIAIIWIATALVIISALVMILAAMWAWFINEWGGS
jgi:hypothetical protein